MGFLNIIKKNRNKQSDNTKTQIAEDLKTQKKEMKDAIDDLASTTVKEIMIPRVDTVCIPVNASKEDLENIIKDNAYSRYPVYEDTIDNIIGVLYSKDILQSIFNHQNLSIKELVRKPYFIPESKKIDALLHEFKHRRVHIAIAVDEYGGVSGIVSFEDILEEIIGDIQDEFDNENEEILKVTDGTYICDARVNIEELNETCGINLPYEDFDTLGGFIFDCFGKIPTRYEKIEWENIVFVVQQIDNHKINTVKMTINNSAEKNHEE